MPAPKRKLKGAISLALVFFLIGVITVADGWRAQQHTPARGRRGSSITPGEAYVAGGLCFLATAYGLVLAFRSREDDHI
jgi:hypothetical protein